MVELRVLFIIALGYVIGSFPTAYIAGRLNGINIFELGSGNMGTTNILRTLGWVWAVIVLALDLGKGVLAVLVGVALAETGVVSVASGSVICAVAAVVGHNWSLFASLLTGTIRGGKGAATAAGTWLLLVPAKILFLPVLVLLIAVIKTRYMSLGVLLGIATAAVSLGILILSNELEASYIIYYLVGVVIVFRFRENIRRLLRGNERRIGERVNI